MATGYVLFNKKAGTAATRQKIEALRQLLPEPLYFADITKVSSYETFFKGMDQDTYVVLCGGDGTLNRFINDTAAIDIHCEILYYPTGTGNDFARELQDTSAQTLYPITAYLKNLPAVTVNGETYRFLNGVGYGIDGYCCQEGDRQRTRQEGPVNYTKIAVKGILGAYKPTGATVTVDGASHRYQKVWLAPTMYGKYYGGGMQPTPDQERSSGELSVMVYHHAGKCKALAVFPSIFQGKHTNHHGMVEILKGQEITVAFDEPRPLQIDGETIFDISSYTASVPKEREETLC